MEDFTFSEIAVKSDILCIQMKIKEKQRGEKKMKETK